MTTQKNPAFRVEATTIGTATVASVLTPEEIADATMRRLRAEITDKFGSVKAIAPHLKSVGYYALIDNLAGKTDMKLSTLYECLALIEMDQVEFARRVMTDAERGR